MGGFGGHLRGEELLRKLQETGKERIRELVRNPLRLSLLCQTSYVLPVDEPLPETKVALYERFTRYFYEWKQEQHLDLTQQDELIDELHEALGKLALAGINSAARFRLGRKLARQEMGERLFKFAERLNWLVLVDREAKTDEAVYAFFHPTFQEYFAACAIDDWHFFLNHVPENPMQGIYRIFEPQWKEVILLWLGRENVPKEQKEEFIEALVEFEDGCGYFYQYQAYFLAAAGGMEFRNSNNADAIVDKLIEWGFTHFNDLMAQIAKAALRETDRMRVIDKLTSQLSSSQYKFTCYEIAMFLLQICPNHQEAIAVVDDELQERQLIVEQGDKEGSFLSLDIQIEHWKYIDELYQDQSTVSEAATQSWGSLQGEELQKQVMKLKYYLRDDVLDQMFNQHGSDYSEIAWSNTWFCACNTQYPDFYQAWHQATIHHRG